jgi:hypothetical protein
MDFCLYSIIKIYCTYSFPHVFVFPTSLYTQIIHLLYPSKLSIKGKMYQLLTVAETKSEAHLFPDLCLSL